MTRVRILQLEIGDFDVFSSQYDEDVKERMGTFIERSWNGGTPSDAIEAGAILEVTVAVPSPPVCMAVRAGQGDV